MQKLRRGDRNEEDGEKEANQRRIHYGPPTVGIENRRPQEAIRLELGFDDDFGRFVGRLVKRTLLEVSWLKLKRSRG